MTVAAANTATINDIADQANDKINRAVKGASDKKFGWWGAAWRITTYFLLFMAALTAVVIGIQFAVAYLAGLGLSAFITGCLTYAIVIVGYLASVYTGWKLSGMTNEAIATACATSAEAKRAAA